MSDAALSARLAALSPERRALLARMLGEPAASGPPAVARIVPDPDAADAGVVEAPLSPAQRRFWALQRVAPDDLAYVGPIAIRLRGALDADALERALHAVARRQAVLRTRIVADGAAAPRQRVLPPADAPPVRLERLAPLELDGERADTTTHDRTIAGRCAAWAARPFDLAGEPPLRAALLPLAPDDHALLLAVHHVADDEWSRQLLWRELAAAYPVALGGGDAASALPPPPFQYADWAASPAVQAPPAPASVEFWRERLRPTPDPLPLPFGRRRRAPRTRAAVTSERHLPADDLAPLRAVARDEGATPFALLLALFQVTLARLGGATDVVVGIPASERASRPELEQLLGVFVNTLPMRLAVAEDATFRALLRDTAAAVPAVLEHAAVPLEELVAIAAPPRSSEHLPLVQALFALDRPEPELAPLGPLPATSIPVRTGEAKADLFLAAREEPDGVRLRLEVAADVQSADDAASVLAVLHRLAIAAGCEPDAPVWTLPLLAPDAAAAALAIGRADPAAPPLDEHAVPSLVREWARRTPDAIAVTSCAADAADALSYSALVAGAHRVAHRLIGCGVERGARVATLFERAPHAVGALLGVLSAGAAYVPLDPAHPAAWLATLVHDAGAAVLLTDRRHAELAHAAASSVVPAPRVLVLDDTDEQAELAALPTSPPDVALTSDDAAYVIYTSGSTGRPKGVVVRHGSIHGLVARQEYVTFRPDLVIGQAATLAFDAATFEIWGALANGGRCVVLPTDVLLEPAELERALRRHGVCTLFLTTALFNALVRSRPQALASLHTLLVGGEAADPAAMRAFRAAAPDVRLVNVYGPTEATTFAAFHVVHEVPDAGPVPIGRPVAGTDLYVLDPMLAPLPPGVAGELCIAGTGVALGYLHLPELTAERFVAAPWSPGTRLYRTGDRCRWRDGGTLEMLGRLDDQLKIRGFRVEPGAIEAELRRLDDVADAAVVLRETGGERSLMACVAPAAGDVADPATFAHRVGVRLAAVLPPYQLPDAVVVLPELPRTPNGKIDRRALATLERDRHIEATANAATAADGAVPRDALEAELCRLFASVLDVPVVAPDDDFFTLGGHSLRALQLVARVEQQVGRAMAASALFTAPTPARLAVLLRDGATGGVAMLHLRTGKRPPFFFLHGEITTGGLYCVELVTDWRSPHGFCLVSLGEPDDGMSIEDVARREVAAIRAVQPHGPYHLGGYCHGATVAFEMARQLSAEGEAVPTLLLLDASGVNAHLGWLRRAAQMTGVVLRWPAEQRRRRFVAWRQRLLDRFVRLRAMSAGARVQHLLRKAPLVAARRLGLVPAPPPPPAEPPAPSRLVAPELKQRWWVMLASYIPTRYDGSIVVGVAEQEARSPGAQVSIAGWQRVARAVRVVQIPGDHDSMRLGDGAVAIRELLAELLAAGDTVP